MDIHLSTPLTELKTVGKTLAKRLSILGLETVEDMLWHVPFRYDDYTSVTPINNLQAGAVTTVRGRVAMIQSRRGWKSRRSITEALLEDESGSVRLIWFNQPYIAKSIVQGEQLAIAGTVKEDKIGLQFVAPQYEKIASGQSTHTGRLVPVYSTTAGITPKHIRFLVKQSLAAVDQVNDWMGKPMSSTYKVMSLPDALRAIHFPHDAKQLARAKQRIGLEELLPIQFSVLYTKGIQRNLRSLSLEFDEKRIKEFVDTLPFVLTPDQKKTTWKIITELQSPTPMRRLVQGDVGSGKTVVAAIACWLAILNERRILFMAPTDVLAHQHMKTFIKLFKNFPVKIALLTGSARISYTCCKGRVVEQKLSKAKIKSAISDGVFDIVIGTHALIQEDIVVPNIALVIVDEQHRFGVSQRQKLLSRTQDDLVPHFLSLSATPIPRTFALMLYGDLDISVIKTMPLGRKPIITKLISPKSRVKTYEFIKQHLDKGQQVYVVCPLIDESDTLGVKSVKQEFEKLNTMVFRDENMAILHGKLKPKEKQETMKAFSDGEIQVLVATSVIEVGVDVPNATIMLIEGAQRFGLAQLHQFRGRVGRGDQQSYCFVSADSAAPNAYKRLQFFSKTTDGFDLAEQDLKTRGPGDVYGKDQSGFAHMRIASLSDVGLMHMVQQVAQDLLALGADMLVLNDMHYGARISTVHLE